MSIVLVGLVKQLGFDKSIHYFYSEMHSFAVGDTVMLCYKSPGGTIYDVVSVKRYDDVSSIPINNFVREPLDHFFLGSKKGHKSRVSQYIHDDFDTMDIRDATTGPYSPDSPKPYEYDNHWDDD